LETAYESDVLEVPLAQCSMTLCKMTKASKDLL